MGASFQNSETKTEMTDLQFALSILFGISLFLTYIEPSNFAGRIFLAEYLLIGFSESFNLNNSQI